MKGVEWKGGGFLVAPRHRGRAAWCRHRCNLDSSLPRRCAYPGRGLPGCPQERFFALQRSHSLRLRARDPLLVGLLSQIIEPRSCINNGISYTFALSRGRSVRPRLQPHLLSYCQVGFCRRGPSCLPLFNAFVPCHWLSNGNQVDLKCNFFPLVGWVGWYLFLVKAPSAAVIPPQRPVMACCVWERGSIQSPISLDRDRCFYYQDNGS